MNRTLARRLSIAAAIVVIGALGVGTAGTSWAQTTTTESSTTTTEAPTTTTTVAACTATFDPDPVPFGSGVTLTVSGFAPGEGVDVAVEGFPLGTFQADGNGVLSQSIPDLPDVITSAIPPEVLAQLAGLDVHFTFTGADGGATCSATLSITLPPTPPTTAAAAKAAAVQATPAFTG